MIKVSFHLLVEQQVTSIGCEGHAMVDTWVAAHVALHVHIRTRWWVCNSLNVADLISDLLARLLARVSRVERLVVAEAV